MSSCTVTPFSLVLDPTLPELSSHSPKTRFPLRSLVPPSTHPARGPGLAAGCAGATALLLDTLALFGSPSSPAHGATPALSVAPLHLPAPNTGLCSGCFHLQTHCRQSHPGSHPAAGLLADLGLAWHPRASLSSPLGYSRHLNLTRARLKSRFHPSPIFLTAINNNFIFSVAQVHLNPRFHAPQGQCPSNLLNLASSFHLPHGLHIPGDISSCVLQSPPVLSVSILAPPPALFPTEDSPLEFSLAVPYALRIWPLSPL